MSNSARFTGTKNTENTARGFQFDFQNPAYAASITLAIKANAAQTIVKISPITGALSLAANIGDANNPPFVGDELMILITSDASIRVVTFATGFKPSGTLSTVASKTVACTFMFDGAGWMETGRAIQA